MKKENLNEELEYLDFLCEEIQNAESNGGVITSSDIFDEDYFFGFLPYRDYSERRLRKFYRKKKRKKKQSNKEKTIDLWNY